MSNIVLNREQIELLILESERLKEKLDAPKDTTIAGLISVAIDKAIVLRAGKPEEYVYSFINKLWKKESALSIRIDRSEWDSYVSIESTKQLFDKYFLDEEKKQVNPYTILIDIVEDCIVDAVTSKILTEKEVKETRKKYTVIKTHTKLSHIYLSKKWFTVDLAIAAIERGDLGEKGKTWEIIGEEYYVEKNALNNYAIKLQNDITLFAWMSESYKGKMKTIWKALSEDKLWWSMDNSGNPIFFKSEIAALFSQAKEKNTPTESKKATEKNAKTKPGNDKENAAE